ncbi:uncharacterized protein LOC127876693 [Dreissena polymorpha]|uniref:uncharacterized protein LOC127876693 n=1 Tax=Dreissena polymorpha TaxID=45954 RepID=UPI002263E788|nr:uncharacterized protein LOC127876693 [Dreissena polymorpha]
MTSILVSSAPAESTRITRLPKSTSRTFDSQSLPGGGLCWIVPYSKPAQRPRPVFERPVKLEDIEPTESNIVRLARLRELLYSVGRSSILCDDISDDQQNIPNWSVFSSQLIRKENKTEASTIAYNPIIMSKPTDYSTIYTTLLRAKEVATSLGQSHIPVVFDMGLLTKALEIDWSQDKKLQGVIPVEGGMHLLMSVFAGIGHLYGDAGLKQLLIDSGTYAPATVNNILLGKDFDRALTAFKLVDEALYNRLLINFDAWCAKNNKNMASEVRMMLSDFRSMPTDTYAESLDRFVDTLSNYLTPYLEEFREEGRNLSSTFSLWDDYLAKVSTPLKLLIASTRSPNWTVYQHAKLQLMPLLFASNRTTYARYMTVQWLQMNMLPQDVKEGFLEGFYTAKLSSGTFNNVWLEYALEATQNKDLKGSGGKVGLTLRENALARWFLARPISSRYSAVFHDSIHATSKPDDKKHNNDSNSKRNQYDKAVMSMTNIFDGNFIDPFDVTKTPEQLINFATGAHANEDVELSMKNCLTKGCELFESFVTEGLVEKSDGTEAPEKDFYSPMPRSKIKSMSDMNSKPSHKKQKAKLINGTVMFQCLLAINTYKKVPSERVFAFENTAVPMSMFTDDGKMIKTRKSDFMKKLEELLPESQTMTSDPLVVIFDGMALVQILPAPSELANFKSMASAFHSYALRKARESSSHV